MLCVRSLKYHNVYGVELGYNVMEGTEYPVSL
jgi:hypothetical protein